MKAGCERREMSNYKLYRPTKPSVTMVQCVKVCENDACNSANIQQLSLQLTLLISLISFILSI